MLRKRILTAHLPVKKTGVLELSPKLKLGQKLDRQLNFELPDFSGALALLVQNGLPVNVALGWLAPRSRGVLAELFQDLNHDLELGADLVERLAEIQSEVSNQGLGELCEKLSVSVLRGAPVAEQLASHAESMRANLMRQLIKQAGANETKMLIPVIFLILPVTVLFAIFPSLLLLANQL